MSKPPSSRSRKPGSPFEKKRGGVKHGKGSKVKAAPAKRPAAPKRETASSTKTPVAPKPAKAMKPASTVALSIPVSADDDGIQIGDGTLSPNFDFYIASMRKSTIKESASVWA